MSEGGCGMAAAGHCGEMLLVASLSVLEGALEGRWALSAFPGPWRGSSLSCPPAARMLGMCLELFAVLCLSFPECRGTSCLSLEVHTLPCALSFANIQHGSVAVNILFGESFGFP